MAAYKVTTTFDWVQYVEAVTVDGQPMTEDKAIEIAQGRYVSFNDLSEVDSPVVQLLETV